MRKILFMALLLVQLAATALAYTNKDDGFKTPSPESGNYVEATGRHFYGFVDDNGSKAGYAECLTPEQAERFFGGKFTTAAFEQKYNDVLLLQRNYISNSRIKELLGKPVVSQLFGFDQDAEPDYIVSAQKFGSNKYIVVTVDTGIGGEPLTLYYTSANDKLYVLMAEQEAPAQKAALEENMIGVIGSADGPTDIYVTGSVPKVTDTNFLKKFKTFQPQAAEQPFGFKEKIAGAAVTLPEDWFYVQLFDNRYNGENIGVTIAMPQQAMQRILSEALDIGVTDIESAVAASREASADSSAIGLKKDELADIFRHGIVLMSVKDNNKSINEYLFADFKQAEYSITESIKELKAYLLKQQAEIKNFDYGVDIKDGQGSFYLQTELKAVQTDFYYNLFAEGKAAGKKAFIVLTFDRTDGGSAALELWQNKAALQK